MCKVAKDVGEQCMGDACIACIGACLVLGSIDVTSSGETEN
jgi:hypothetical protein